VAGFCLTVLAAKTRMGSWGGGTGLVKPIQRLLGTHVKGIGFQPAMQRANFLGETLMRCVVCAKCLMTVMVILVLTGTAQAQATFEVPTITSGIVLPDNKTFVVSVASKATLIYYDTVADKEARRVELDFKPSFLAAQGDKLFVAAKGTATVHVLEAATGNEVKAIKLPGEPVQALGCHPAKGLLYAVNSNNEVYAVDPDKGTATKTKAIGQLLAVDPVEGKFVYTGIQKPIRDVVVVEKGPGGKATLSLAQANLRALMIKYEVNDNDLKAVAANDNAAVNGWSMTLSADGKKIAMIGGGGWRSKTDPKVRYGAVFFDTSDLETQVGQWGDVPGTTVSIVFHPVLNLGASYQEGHGVVLFSAKSLASKDSFKVKKGAIPTLLAFGGQGTKLIVAPMPGGPGSDMQSVIEFLPLPLTDQDKAALKKAYSK
jgi:hypothetical protein